MSDEVAVNERGGKQSKLAVRHDLLPHVAVQKVAEVVAEGAAKYATNNWRLIEVESHLNHALAHVNNYLRQSVAPDGADSVEELSHAACRVLMALETHLVGVWEAGDKRIGPDPQATKQPEVKMCGGTVDPLYLRPCLDPESCQDAMFCERARLGIA